MSKQWSILKTVLLNIVVLGLIFIVAVLGFSRFINQTAPSTAENMANSTFPLVYMQNNGVSYNCLHGYAQEMDVNYIRDTVTVLPDSHTLNVQIQPFNTNIETLSYEILSLDGIHSLENTNVINMKEDSGYVYASLQIQNTMLLEQEYILKLQVSAGGRNIYYYTRILLEDGLHLETYLDFVTGFYEKCINKSDENSIGEVVEPNEYTGTSRTLASMNIHDSVAQLMWGDLNPQMYYKPTPSLVDINGTTASFVLDYRISAVDANGVSNIYNVKEFYRLRYTDTRIFLLDFTRSTEEVLNTEKNILEPKGINLGISNGNIEFAFDPQKKIVAFVRENELWTYRVNSGRMTRVFGFPQKENMDYRDFYDQNNIKVLQVQNNGDVWFAVSGYMNRGNREGENGIGIYYYEEASSTVEEILFVQTMEAYDSLKLDIDSLAYITDDQEKCYILLEGVIYRINLNTREYEQVVNGINNSCFVSSDSNRHFSWLEEGKRFQSQTIHMIDFETGSIQDITCHPDEYLRPICYLDEDLVYGAAFSADINTADEGNELFPMYQLKIVNPEGELIKTYQPGDCYVMSVEQQNNMLVLHRGVWNGSTYSEVLEDHIVNTNTEEDVAYGVTTKEDKIKQTEILLRVGAEITDKNLQVVTGRLLVHEGSRQIEIPSNPNREKLYHVYAGGCLESSWTTAAEAIRRADEKVGVVINESKEFVWERGNKKESCKIHLEDIPDAVKAGIMDVPELEAALGKDVVSLTGCTLEEVLYFVGQGHAVLALTSNGPVIITGYDDFGNLILLNPGESETYFYGPQDSVALFEASGNRFVSYLNTDV